MTVGVASLELNESQQEAVNWQEGPLLVLAGPGSGKTRVLTLRIARLIDESPDSRFRVLGITFTNKAAIEMRQRIDTLLERGRDRVTLTTFHAFAAEILRQHGSHVGLRPDFSILADRADCEAALSDAMKDALQGNNEFAPQAAQLLDVITRMLDECVPENDAETSVKIGAHAKEIALIYAAYRQRLIASNQLDFATLLALAVELLETKPAIARQLRRVYTHVCVDECQDTNLAQFRLLVQIVPEQRPNLFVVADDDQVIYQWNGASPARLKELRERFSMDVLQLPENYRCPPVVIDLANKLIAHNNDRPPGKKPLTAHKTADASDGLLAKGFADFSQELAWVAKQLKPLPPDERSGCVILARRKKLLEEAVAVLSEHSVPAYIAVRKNEFESAPYRFLHSMLRLANAPQDREHLRRMTRAFFELEGVKISTQDVMPVASVNQEGYLRAWLFLADQRGEISRSTKAFLMNATLALADRLAYRDFVALCQEWFGVVRQKTDGSISEQAFDQFDDEMQIWNALEAEIELQHERSSLSLHTFLQELDLRAKEKPAPPGAVRCLTIASSKGMEFKRVYLIGLVEDELPGFYARKKGDQSDAMCEERRNCFVAITRAEDFLALTFSKRYFGYSKQPSRFLNEMGLSLK